MKAAILNDNGTLIVRHADGTTEAFAELKTRATAGLPEDLRGDMTRSMKFQSGNFNVSFDDSYFPSSDKSKSDEENQAIRNQTTARKFATIGAIVAELSRVGLKAHEDYQARDSYQPKGQNTWKATMQLMLRVEGATTSSSAPSLQQQLTLAMIANEAAVEALFTSPLSFKDGELTEYGRAKLGMIIAKAAGGPKVAPGTTAPVEETSETEETEGDGNEMPTD